MRRFLLILLVLLCAFASVVQAQSTDLQESQFRLFNNTSVSLDEDAIRQAAQPLMDSGATVVIYLVNAGNRQNFQFRLESEGYFSAGKTHPEVIAIYVALVSPYSHLRWGADWGRDLNDWGETIRQENLNPYLVQKDYSLGISETLRAIHEVNQRNFLERLTPAGWVKFGLSAGFFIFLGLALGWFKVLLFPKAV